MWFHAEMRDKDEKVREYSLFHSFQYPNLLRLVKAFEIDRRSYIEVEIVRESGRKTSFVIL